MVQNNYSPLVNARRFYTLEKSTHFCTKISGESSGVKRPLFEFSFQRDHE